MRHYNTLITAAAYTAETFTRSGFLGSRNMEEIDGRALVLRAIDSYYQPGGLLSVAVNAEEETQGMGSKSTVLEHYPQARMVETNSKTQGALASALLSLNDFPMDEPLLIATGDSFLTKSVSDILSNDLFEGFGALTLSFESENPRWSYLGTNSEGKVMEVAEKLVISRIATTGTFLFRQASDFVEAAEWVLLNNASTQGRYFVSTALNYLISRGLEVTFVPIQRSEYFNLSLPADFVRQAK
jgi:dTDP-glucose pyrophosphorylase